MKALIGGCLQAVGILIAGLFGICTLIAMSSIDSWSSFVETIGSILTFAAIPIVIGIGLIWAGRALVRSANDYDGRSY